MAHIHEPRLPSPALSDCTSLLAPPRSATSDGVNDDSDISPLTYAQFSALIQQTLDGVSFSDLIVIKRNDWEAQQQKLRKAGFAEDEDEGLAAKLYDLGIQHEIGVRVEKVRMSIENTYESLLKANREELAEKYGKEMEKLRGRIKDLEVQKEGFKFCLSRKGSSNSMNGTNSPRSLDDSSLKEAVAAALGNVSNGNGGPPTEMTDDLLAKAEARILDLETQISCLKQILFIRLTDRATNITNTSRSGIHILHSPSASMFESISNPPRHASPIMIPVAPKILSSPHTRTPAPTAPTSRRPSHNVPLQQSMAPRLTTAKLIQETTSFRRVLYITNLGPNFSLPSVLSCITVGPVENVMPFYPRGSCLLFFVRPQDAKTFLNSSRSSAPHGPFDNKYPAVVRWANYAISKMDWIIASSIVSQGATRILRVKGLKEGTRKEEIESWWGDMRKFLIGIKMVVLDDGGRRVWAAEIECMSVRDASWRWRKVVEMMKKGRLTGVTVEWVEDYCGRGPEDRKEHKAAIEVESGL